MRTLAIACGWSWVFGGMVLRRLVRRRTRRRLPRRDHSTRVIVTTRWILGPFERVLADLRSRRTRRLAGLERDLARTYDLLGVAVASGDTMSQAVPRVEPWCDEPIRTSLLRVDRRVRLGMSLPHALADEAATQPALWSLARTITAIQSSGASAQVALRAAAADARREHRRRAQVEARALSVRLLFPLVLCSFPAFVLTALVPIAMSAVQSR